jgi:2-octaprenyl-6-methoxyphenol hydroxylase
MQYDIAIIGGGMVGAALAVALKESSHRVILIDAALSHAQDHRLIALNHSSCTLFQNLGLWQYLQEEATAIKEVHVSTRGHFGTTRLSAEDMKLRQLGHVVPAKKINSVLYEQLIDAKNITVLRPAKLTAITQDENEVSFTVTLPSGVETLRAKVLIAADGTLSSVRELLSIPTERIDYQQKALVTITQLQRAHKHIAYERFLDQGAIAMLPLKNQHVATIWSGSNTVIESLAAMSEQEFLHQLQAQFGYRLGKVKSIQTRYVYPLQFIKAKKQIWDRVMLIGNAAHTILPIAAQGLNLALYEIACLAEEFNQQTTEPSLANLPDQIEQQAASIETSHRLTKLFLADFFLYKAARQLGMLGLDICKPLKTRFTMRLLGQAGYSPPLLIDTDS